MTVRDEFHTNWFTTGCDSEAVARLLTFVGAKKWPDQYVVSVGKERPCHW